MTTDLDKQVAVIDSMLEFMDDGRRWIRNDYVVDVGGGVMFSLPPLEHEEEIGGCCTLGAAAVAYRRHYSAAASTVQADDVDDIDEIIGLIAFQEVPEPFLVAIYEAIVDAAGGAAEAHPKGHVLTWPIGRFNDDATDYGKVKAILLDARARLLAQNA